MTVPQICKYSGNLFYEFEYDLQFVKGGGIPDFWSTEFRQDM